MEQYKLGEMERRFAQLIWDSAPVSTKKLTEMCGEEFQWKRTTTYTMLKRLCERGIFENQNGTVITLISKEDFDMGQSQQFVQETFNGSLPMFLTRFSKNKKLSKDDIDMLQKLIDSHRKD